VEATSKARLAAPGPLWLWLLRQRQGWIGKYLRGLLSGSGARSGVRCARRRRLGILFCGGVRGRHGHCRSSRARACLGRATRLNFRRVDIGWWWGIVCFLPAAHRQRGRHHNSRCPCQFSNVFHGRHYYPLIEKSTNRSVERPTLPGLSRLPWATPCCSTLRYRATSGPLVAPSTASGSWACRG
jgi:hypothetical protein